MSDLPTSLTVDLSRLPAPAFVDALSFEDVRAARLADFQARWPGFDALVESDPAMKLVETGAYRELLIRGAVNDAGRAVMLAFAQGADLDQLAANLGLVRMTIAAATNTTAAVLESDDDLRTRVQLAPETLAIGGLTAGGYRAIALRAAPGVADIAPIRRGGGQVDVVLLGRDGPATEAQVAAVSAAFSADDVAALTDTIVARTATVTRYSPTVTLRIRRGPDPGLIQANAARAVRAYAAARARIGLPVYASMIEAAAAVGGVELARVDIADIVPPADGAALLDQLTIVVEVVA